MKKLILRFGIYLFLVSGILGFASSAEAAVYFEKPYVGPATQLKSYIENGAWAYVMVKYRNDSGSEVLIDSVKLWMRYDTTWVENTGGFPISVANQNSGNFQVAQNETAGGELKYQLTISASSPNPLRVAGGALANIALIRFHIKQDDALRGDIPISILTFWDLDPLSNYVFLKQGGVDKTGAKFNYNDPSYPGGPVDLRIEETHRPVFPPPNEGIDSVRDPETGNTLILGWPNCASTAHDHATDKAETFFAAGQHLRYNVYQSYPAPAMPGTLLASGTRMDAAGLTVTGLSDGTTYYYVVRGLDDCKARENENLSTKQLSGIPTDHTPPPAPNLAAPDPDDQLLNLSWGGSEGGDFGGYVLYRKDGGAPTHTFTGAHGVENGETPPAAGTILPDGSKVLYVGTGRALTDRGTDLPAGSLINGHPYGYMVAAFDRAVAGPPREQGYNYSYSVPRIGYPGAKPRPLKNFLSVSGPGGGQITLRWNPEGNQGGAKILATKNLDAWASTQFDSEVTSPDAYVLVMDKPHADPLPAQEEVVVNSIGASPLEEGAVYYFSGFAYNRTPDPTARKFSDLAYGGAVKGGAGGAGPITVNLKKQPGGLGLNPLAVVHDLPIYADTTPVMEIRNYLQLAQAINLKAGENVVTTIGRLVNSQIEGYTFIWGAGLNQLTGYQSTAGLPPPESVELARGDALQISVAKDVTFIMSGGM